MSKYSPTTLKKVKVHFYLFVMGKKEKNRHWKAQTDLSGTYEQKTVLFKELFDPVGNFLTFALFSPINNFKQKKENVGNHLM